MHIMHAYHACMHVVHACYACMYISLCRLRPRWRKGVIHSGLVGNESSPYLSRDFCLEAVGLGGAAPQDYSGIRGGGSVGRSRPGLCMHACISCISSMHMHAYYACMNIINSRCACKNIMHAHTACILCMH